MLDGDRYLGFSLVLDNFMDIHDNAGLYAYSIFRVPTIRG